MQLIGTEAHTLELEGSIPLAAAARLLPAPLRPEAIDADRARVALLLFAMQGLRPRGLPAFLGSSYREALWRVGAMLDDQPVWLASACDIDRAHVRRLGAWLVRYPVVAARISEGWSVETAHGRFEAEAAPLDEAQPEPVPPRRALVREGDRVWEIPWREDPGPWRRAARFEVREDARARAAFGLAPGEPLEWTGGLLLRGRVHRCGVAARFRVDSRPLEGR